MDAISSLLENSIIVKAASALVMFLVGLMLLKILLIFVRRTLERSRLDQVLYTFVVNTVKVVCLILLVITVLTHLGVPTGSFVTVIAAGGAAIALALKDSLGNFAGGILIMVQKPFRQGDLISSNGVEGRVQHIDLLYTTLLTLNYQTITIPNGLLANNTIINYSMSECRRIDVQVGISYSSDIEQARRCILDVITRSGSYLDSPAPLVGVAEHGDSAVILDVQAWCETERFFNARYELRESIKKAFDEAGIEIPFTQITIHNDIEDFPSGDSTADIPAADDAAAGAARLKSGAEGEN